MSALGLHEDSLREAVHHLKFNGRQDLGEPLGRRLGQLVKTPYDFIVPMPLHRSRLRERGYNQALLIASGIAAVTGAPVADQILVRLRSTGHQAKLDRQERLQNLTGAFRMTGLNMTGPTRTALLVDDVLTTGATAMAAAQALRVGGVGQVHMAVLAVSKKAVQAANHSPTTHKIPINNSSPGVDILSEPNGPGLLKPDPSGGVQGENK